MLKMIAIAVAVLVGGILQGLVNLKSITEE